MPRFYLLLSTILAAPAWAEATPDADAILVMGLRTPLVIDRVATAVTVLDRAASDASQALVVSDLIARTPGVTVSRTGGFGTTTGVRIRGAESDQTVVVIDGVKLNDPSSPGGGYDFGDLFVGDADRIEILRGSQSTLWGSQAIGGVVNIVTDVPTAPLTGSAEVEDGSRGTASGRFGVGGRSDAITWRVAGNAMRTDGISAIAPEYGGQERDGYRHVGGSGRLEARLTPDVSIDLRGYWSHGRVELDSSFGPPDTPDYSLSTNWTGYAGLNIALFDGRLRNRIAYTRSQIDRDNHDPSLSGSTKTFDARGRNEHVEYQGSLTIVQGWDATFGVEHERSRFRALSPQYQTVPDRGAVSIDSVYGQVVGAIAKGVTLNAGLRHDDHQTFGGKTLFSGGAVWAIGSTTLRASYAEGFKAPTLYQLFSEYGNRDLRPEQAHGWDGGVAQTLADGHVTLSATYFDRRTTNLVQFAFSPPRADRPFGYYQNVARARSRGIEATAAATLGRLTLDANFSWIDAEDRSAGATAGKDLIRRPHDTANASATYAWPSGLATTVALTHVGHSFEDAANTTRLAAYTLVDLRAEMPIGRALTLFGRIENLADEKYETAYRYGTLGRSVYGGVRAKF